MKFPKLGPTRPSIIRSRKVTQMLINGPQNSVTKTSPVPNPVISRIKINRTKKRGKTLSIITEEITKALGVPIIAKNQI